MVIKGIPNATATLVEKLVPYLKGTGAQWKWLKSSNNIAASDTIEPIVKESPSHSYLVLTP